MDEVESIDLGVKSPIKRLGSTRKLLFFNSKWFLIFLTNLLSFIRSLQMCSKIEADIIIPT